MNFEKIEIKNQTDQNSLDQERLFLYPERASVRVKRDIERIEKIKSGEMKKIKLNIREKKDLLYFENGLGEELEDVDAIKIIKEDVYIEYFLTEEGKEDFFEVVGLKIQENNAENVEKFLFKNRKVIERVSAERKKELFGRSRDYSDEKLLNQLLGVMDENGNVDVSRFDNPRRISILENPQDVVEKIKRLRELRKNMKEASESLGSENLDLAKRKIIEIYKRKINEMIAEQFSNLASAMRMQEVLGKEELNDAEAGLAQQFPGIKDVVKTYSRYDKLIHGASEQYNESGMREQIGSELEEFAHNLREVYIDNECKKSEALKEKGLDSKKVYKKNITVQEFSEMAEEFLAHYGEKSVEDASTYDPERNGPATDGKWQFIAREYISSMSTDSKQKVIKSGDDNSSIYGVLTGLLGHEMGGHFFQNLNSAEIDLRLFKKIQGDRRAVLAEAGAMDMQDRVCQGAFGFRAYPHVNYINAMLRRLKGGTYLDCVKEFYEGGREVIVRKKEKGIIDNEKARKQFREKLELAINRAKRLFQPGVDFDSTESFLVKSKDTAYLEQYFVMEELKKRGLEKYAYVLGMNLQTLGDLYELDLIDPSKFREPDLYALEIWDKIKYRYMLQGAGLD